ncbi:uncharacterized protein CXQ87_002449 [Candidozyma duobushaemuli]|uniref:Uncharacterized protein n=2 Tax=Candidozyma TaxID=3303203 RepID=A0ABX8I4Y0_9ASCO|nr:uncharacterized protein CXQ87_002449 [[Candida] duobushaemulonis]PVH14321.1 hypothetical protein CXQ87_002449 [[Candida] duobushaemulonis]QWU87504.1 hypothetical protein CA3LBN_001769 [[Candida] haemuloni]
MYHAQEYRKNISSFHRKAERVSYLNETQIPQNHLLTKINLRLKKDQPFKQSLKRTSFKVINFLGLTAPDPSEERLRVRCGFRRHMLELLKNPKEEAILLKDRLKLKAFQFAEVEPAKPCLSFRSSKSKQPSKHSSKRSSKAFSSHQSSVFESAPHSVEPPSVSSMEDVAPDIIGPWMAVHSLFESLPKEPRNFKELSDFSRKEKCRLKHTKNFFTNTRWMDCKHALRNFPSDLGLCKNDKLSNFGNMLENLEKKRRSIARSNNKHLAKQADQMLNEVYSRIDEANNNHKNAVVAVHREHKHLKKRMLRSLKDLHKLSLDHASTREKICQRLEKNGSFPGADKVIESELSKFQDISLRIYDLNSSAASLQKKTLQQLQSLDKAHANLARFCKGLNDQQYHLTRKLESSMVSKPRHAYNYSPYKKALKDHQGHYDRMTKYTEHLIDSLFKEMVGLYHEFAEA